MMTATTGRYAVLNITVAIAKNNTMKSNFHFLEKMLSMVANKKKPKNSNDNTSVITKRSYNNCKGSKQYMTAIPALKYLLTLR